MRLVTVGTGTVVPDANRASACHWVEHGGTRAVVDCGAGALQGLARADLPWGDVTHLFISHFHADHIAEIPSLIFALRHGLALPREAQLDVCGPVGTAQLFETWAAAYGPWILEPGFTVSISEMRPDVALELEDFAVRGAETPHTPESLAFRFETAAAVLGYTGDTGPSEALAEFFRGVDLLLSECSLPDELVGDNHLSPAHLARMATAAEVSRLAVTHVYPQLRQLDVPELIRAAGYVGEIVMADDGLELAV